VVQSTWLFFAVDTIYAVGTIYAVDTIYALDTIYAVGTIYAVDTIYAVGTIYAVDTIYLFIIATCSKTRIIIGQENLKIQIGQCLKHLHFL